MELSPNQSALILEMSDDGEIFISVASGDHDGLTASICAALAEKLADADFQQEILEMIGD
jgi:hypothetical protein